jgi:hypothetical protein
MEVVPKHGLVDEESSRWLVLCKPKLLPLTPGPPQVTAASPTHAGPAATEEPEPLGFSEPEPSSTVMVSYNQVGLYDLIKSMMGIDGQGILQGSFTSLSIVENLKWASRSRRP